jgi:exosortase
LSEFGTYRPRLIELPVGRFLSTSVVVATNSTVSIPDIETHRGAGANDATEGRWRSSGWVFLVVAAILWAVPSIWELARQAWYSEQGAQLAIVAPTTIWLFTREWPRDRALAPGNWRIASIAIGLIILLNLAAAFVGVLFLEILTIELGAVAILYALGGMALCRRLWLPLIYGLAILPLPSTIMGPATAQLKLIVAQASVDLLGVVGLDVARSGTSIYVDQYELVIEAACSGVNSIVGLMAVGLLYAYLQHRGSVARVAALAIAAVVVAIVANIIRVVVLGLLVDRYGVYLLDTPLHGGTGLAMFAIAVILLIAIDAVGGRVAQRLRALRSPSLGRG